MLISSQLHQNTEETEVSTKDFDVVRSKIFNFYSVRSAVIAKLKMKNNHKLEMCKYKLDLGSNGNGLHNVQNASFPHKNCQSKQLHRKRNNIMHL